MRLSCTAVLLMAPKPRTVVNAMMSEEIGSIMYKCGQGQELGAVIYIYIYIYIVLLPWQGAAAGSITKHHCGVCGKKPTKSAH